MKFACHIQFDSDDLNEAIAIIDTLLASEEGQKLTKPGQPVRTEIQQLKIESVNHLRKDEAFDGQYVIKSVLGISASGIVYKAACLISERVVAIKVLHRDCAADPFLIAQLSSEPRGASA